MELRRTAAFAASFAASITLIAGIASSAPRAFAGHIDGIPVHIGEKFEVHGSLKSGPGMLKSLATFDAMLQIANPGSSFGADVASIGDVNADGFDDVVVGAPNFTDGGETLGAAYVKFGGPVPIDTTPDLMLDVDQADTQFGTAVAGVGDINCDGHADVAVGAYRYVPAIENVGSVFIYFGGPDFDSNSDFRLDGTQSAASFGFSVAGLGDVDGDGCDELAVGAPNHDFGLGPEGAVFVYIGAASIDTAPSQILSPSGSIESQFGWTVDGAGDVNGDGLADIVVGAFRHDNGEENEGAVMIYHGMNGSLGGGIPALVLEGNATDAAFGFSVAGVGDVNGDGFDDIAVGAPFRTFDQTEEGAVFVYTGSPSGVDPGSVVALEREQEQAAFGWDVAGGDVNADGHADVLVGAPFYDNGQTDEGMVQLYYGGPGALDSVRDALFQLDQDFASTGVSITAGGDLNGDGVDDVLVGAPTYGDAEVGGVAAVFLGDDTLFEYDFEPPNQ